MDEGAIPGAAERARRNASTAKADCVIVLGNHASHSGIGDIVYSIYEHFSRNRRVQAAEGVAPGKLNIIVDEFSNPYFVEFLKETKRTHKGTKYAIVATEFYTPISLLGVRLGTTFNFFGEIPDWIRAGRILESRLLCGLHRLPYLHRRYVGFVAALEIADVVLTTHPKIGESLKAFAKSNVRDMPPCATLYPSIDLERGDRIKRLRTLPFGYAMTGTLTPHRKTVAKRLEAAFRWAGYDWPVYLHVPFADSGRLELADYPQETPKYLYNLNPPQTRRWRYSSPMRILHAALLGQIPVVTKKFGDHAIEDIALELSQPLKTDQAQKLWCEATVGREQLVTAYAASVASYDALARHKNKSVEDICRKAGVI